MTSAGKTIVVVGLVLLAVGAVVWGLGRLGFKGLPGDMTFQSASTKVYFPIVSCLVLSAVLTLVLWIVGWVLRTHR